MPDADGLQPVRGVPRKPAGRSELCRAARFFEHILTDILGNVGSSSGTAVILRHIGDAQPLASLGALQGEELSFATSDVMRKFDSYPSLLQARASDQAILRPRNVSCMTMMQIHLSRPPALLDLVVFGLASSPSVFSPTVSTSMPLADVPDASSYSASG